MGSKAKITKYIVPIIQQKIDESGARYYVEPFAGGCNVIDKIKAEYRIASDSNKYLIALFQHLQDGGGLPEHITREEYNKAREAYRTGDNSLQAWYIGAVGFLASYNGRFYDGGYAGYGKDKGRVRDYYRESRRSRHNNIVLISELQAPDDFITIWEKEVDRSMKAKEHFRATEKLFMWGG